MLCRLSAVIVVERAADDPARHGGEMNSPFLNAAGWDAEVTKMIAAFGAPIQSERREDHRRLPEGQLRAVTWAGRIARM
jgi:hypothetical protein